MVATVIIFALTCCLLIASVLGFSNIKIKSRVLHTYWIICLAGAIFMLAFNRISLKEAFAGITANSSINPLKILIIFISMTFLSIFLDEIGFFGYLAKIATRLAGSKQTALFFSLYTVVSVLTVFTSNDIVILTFTPFICYFAKNTKIDPVPYLVAEFAGANTWSMMLIIGNPTNIYLATFANIGFIDYLKVMALPTVFAGVVQIAIIYLLFRKKLKAPLLVGEIRGKIKNKPLLIIGLFHLGGCLLFLTVSSHIAIEMWIICLSFMISLILCSSVYILIKKKKFEPLLNTEKRLPWDIIPFVLSMFVIVLALKKQGFTDIIGKTLGQDGVIFKYGFTSFIACNLINNIPMSVLFSTVPNMANIVLYKQAIFSTVIGSNVGAFLTPIGALAGIMFTGLVVQHNVKYGFLNFIKYGIIISIPTILSALLGLCLVL